MFSVRYNLCWMYVPTLDLDYGTVFHLYLFFILQDHAPQQILTARAHIAAKR